jgi:hypothetical protein
MQRFDAALSTSDNGINLVEGDSGETGQVRSSNPWPLAMLAQTPGASIEMAM